MKMRDRSCVSCVKKRRCFEAFIRGKCSDYKKGGRKRDDKNDIQ